MLAIRDAGPGDMAALNIALAALSEDLGDIHRAGPEMLAAALHGPGGFAAALLAERAGTPLGAALFSPVFSTTLGGAGVYVTDLWVSPSERRGGLGRRLVSAVARRAQARWQARYLSLMVYSENDAALAFYRRLGFTIEDGERPARLVGPAFVTLAGEPP